MALDEPKQEDKQIDFGPYRFVLAPDVVDMVGQFGGVAIDYVDEGFRKGYTIQLVRGGGGCGHDH